MDLVASIGLGVVLVVLVFFALHRFTPLNSKQTALVVALLATAGYLPFAIIRWPGADVVTMHLAIYLVVAYMLGIIGYQRDVVQAEGGSRKWFHWGPALIVAFFGVIITVDSVFVTLAIHGMPENIERELLPKQLAERPASTVFPGVVHDHYFQKENAFNDYLEQVAAQRKEGWTVHKGWLTDQPAAGKPAVFQLQVLDRDGKPVASARVQGRFVRPSNSRLDQTFTMAEVKPGLYQAKLVLPQPGVWGLQVRVDKGKLSYQLRASTSVLDATTAANP